MSRHTLNIEMPLMLKVELAYTPADPGCWNPSSHSFRPPEPESIEILSTSYEQHDIELSDADYERLEQHIMEARNNEQ